MIHSQDRGEPAVTSDEQVGELVKLAGPRPMPDAAQMSRARAAARAEWARIVERRSWPRSLFGLTGAALAAGLVAIATWVWLDHPSAPPPRVDVATLQVTRGTVILSNVDRQNHAAIGAGSRLHAGDRVETSEASRAAFTLEEGVSVRLDRSTAAVFESTDRMTLDRGALYVDTGAGPRRSALTIKTPLGIVRHIGTQFEVRLQGSAVRVRVREGTIAVEDGNQRWTSGSGEALVLLRGRPPERKTIATSGSEWDWVSDVANPFRLEGATLRSFLQWVSREQGWSWHFEDPTMKPIEQTTLHGSIEGLSAEEALAAVLPTCGLTSRREGDRLIVSALSPRR